MEIVIDIPKEYYETLKEMSDETLSMDMAIIKYGTPLPEYLNKIKAEIEQKQYDFMANKDYVEGIRFGLMLAYQIINKYIEGSDSE